MDKYESYAHLSRHEIEGKDYRIQVRYGYTRIAIMAPHGGMIERGTTPLADAIAGNRHSFYSFEGLKPRLKDNRYLHVTSNRFDESQALEMTEKVDKVITVHGAAGAEVAVYAGGLDLKLKKAIVRWLSESGFHAAPDPSPTRQGKGVTNICNRGASRSGLQLELTSGLRRRMFGPPDTSGLRARTQVFFDFVECVREVLESSIIRP